MNNLYYPVLAFVVLAMAACAPKVAPSVGEAEGAAESFRKTAPEPGPARAIEIGDYETFKLDNGLQVIVVENHKLPVISYRLYVDRDPIVEGEDAGMTSIVGDLLSRGTTSRTKAEIDEAVDFVGGSLSTNSRGGFASSLTRHTDIVLDIFSDVILNPTFPEDEFEKIRTQTISGLQAQKDDPNAISSNVSNALIYGKDHPYGELMTETTVQSISVEDCKEYYNTYFKPNAAYLVVVGDITEDEVRKKARKSFGAWKKGDVPQHEYDTPEPPAATQVDFVDKAGAVQSVIRITYPVVLEPGSEDVIKSRVMNTILGSGFSGRLFRNLREDKGYTYGAYSSLSSDELIGTFAATASVRNEVTDSAITEFLVELNRMREEKVTDQELELAKNYIAGSFARSLESPQTVANFALNTFRYDLPEDYYATYLEKLEMVTADDVLEMAQKYVQPGQARIVVVGNQDQVSEKLQKFDAENGKVTFYDIYANVKAPPAEAGDVTGAQVIEAYLEAIGGREAIAGVKTMQQEMSMSMMGQELNVVQQNAVPNKFRMEMTTQGMTVMKQVFNGVEGYQEQMGQRAPLEGDDLEQMKYRGKIVPEMEYLTEGFSLEVKGIEDVDGEMAYKVIVTDPTGTESTEFYSQDTGYKIKAITTQDAGGQTMTQTIVYDDYKKIGDLVLPHIAKISGMGPAPMEMKVQDVQVNVDLPEDAFDVN